MQLPAERESPRSIRELIRQCTRLADPIESTAVGPTRNEANQAYPGFIVLFTPAPRRKKDYAHTPSTF